MNAMRSESNPASTSCVPIAAVPAPSGTVIFTGHSLGGAAAVIVAAERMGLGLVNTFMGADAAKHQDANWEEALRVWPAIVAFARDHGVRITFENCPMIFSYDEWPGGHNLATTPRIASMPCCRTLATT